MPELGSRKYFGYTSDNGKTYQFYGRQEDNVQAGNTPEAAGANPSVPARLKKRHVWAVASPGVRRKFWIGQLSNGHYSGGGTITVSGTAWVIEGRVGEKDQGVVTD